MAPGTQSRIGKGEPNVAARVREARALTGLSQTKLAKELGQGARTVQAWERGERIPRLGALEGLAKFVDRPVSWFYEAPQDEPEREAA